MDITGRIEAEEKLEEAKRLLDALMEKMSRKGSLSRRLPTDGSRWSASTGRQCSAARTTR